MSTIGTWDDGSKPDLHGAGNWKWQLKISGSEKGNRKNCCATNVTQILDTYQYKKYPRNYLAVTAYNVFIFLRKCFNFWAVLLRNARIYVDFPKHA